MIDPLRLRRGPALRVPYYDRRTPTIVDGARQVSARVPAEVMWLARPRAGYLVLSDQGDAGLGLRLVTPSGRVRLLVQSGLLELGPVAAGGRRFLYSIVTDGRTDTDGHTDISLARVGDGRVLASRSFAARSTRSSTSVDTGR